MLLPGLESALAFALILIPLLRILSVRSVAE
jgi:hypothetical protein